MRLNENRNTTPTKADPQTFRTKASPVGLRRWCKDNNDYTRQYASSRGRTARVHTQARSIVEFQICCCTGSVRCPGRASARRYRVLRRWLADHHHERLSDLAGINLAQVCPNRPAGREWVLARQASLICIRPFQRGYAVKGHFPRITTTTKPKAVSEHMHRDLCTRVPEKTRCQSQVGAEATGLLSTLQSPGSHRVRAPCHPCDPCSMPCPTRFHRPRTR